MNATEQQDWAPCPSGELGRMVDARRAQRRRQVIDRFAVVAATLMVLIAVGGFTMGLLTPKPSTQGRSGGLTCSEVAAALPAYATGEIPAEQYQRIAIHLQNCDGCQQRYEQLLETASAVLREVVLFANLSE